MPTRFCLGTMLHLHPKAYRKRSFPYSHERAAQVPVYLLCSDCLCRHLFGIPPRRALPLRLSRRRGFAIDCRLGLPFDRLAPWLPRGLASEEGGVRGNAAGHHEVVDLSRRETLRINRSTAAPIDRHVHQWGAEVCGDRLAVAVAQHDLDRLELDLLVLRVIAQVHQARDVRRALEHAELANLLHLRRDRRLALRIAAYAAQEPARLVPT